MKPAPRDVLAFIDYARGACARFNVKLRLEAREMSTSKDSGYFLDDKRVLYVAALNAKWPSTLAHELGHLEQRSEGLFLDYDQGPLQRHVDGEAVKPAELRRSVRNVQRCELDAERRALHLVRDFHLTMDINQYVKDSNAYVWSFDLRMRYRTRWAPGQFPSLTYNHLLPDKLMRVRDISKIEPELEWAMVSENQAHLNS